MYYNGTYTQLNSMLYLFGQNQAVNISCVTINLQLNNSYVGFSLLSNLTQTTQTMMTGVIINMTVMACYNFYLLNYLNGTGALSNFSVNLTLNASVAPVVSLGFVNATNSSLGYSKFYINVTSSVSVVLVGQQVNVSSRLSVSNVVISTTMVNGSWSLLTNISNSLVNYTNSTSVMTL